MFSGELVANLVCKHLLDLGLKSRVRKAVVETGVADLKVIARVEEAKTRPDSTLVPLTFGHQSASLKTGSDDYLWDCSTGMAEEPEQALSNAVHSWLEGVWPVMVAAHACVAGDGITNKRTYIYSAQRNRFEVWRIVLGPMQGNDEGLTPIGDRQPFLDVLFKPGFIPGLFDKEFRIWALRCFVSRIAGTFTKELRVNWHSAEALNSMLDGVVLNWPKNSSPLLLRQFVALVPTDEQPTPQERQYLIDEMEKGEA